MRLEISLLSLSGHIVPSSATKEASPLQLPLMGTCACLPPNTELTQCRRGGGKGERKKGERGKRKDGHVYRTSVEAHTGHSVEAHTQDTVWKETHRTSVEGHTQDTVWKHTQDTV